MGVLRGIGYQGLNFEWILELLDVDIDRRYWIGCKSKLVIGLLVITRKDPYYPYYNFLERLVNII